MTVGKDKDMWDYCEFEQVDFSPIRLISHSSAIQLPLNFQTEIRLLPTEDLNAEHANEPI